MWQPCLSPETDVASGTFAGGACAAEDPLEVHSEYRVLVQGTARTGDGHFGAGRAAGGSCRQVGGGSRVGAFGQCCCRQINLHTNLCSYQWLRSHAAHVSDGCCASAVRRVAACDGAPSTMRRS